MVLSLRRSPAIPFWTRAWVINVLPLASSLLLHATLILLGILLYQAVKQVKGPERQQPIVPEMSSIQRAALPAIVHPGIYDDLTRPARQEIDRITPPDGVGVAPGNNFPAESDLPGAETGNTPGPAGDPKLEQVLKQIADESHGHFRKILKSDM
jgi:hypothetical protein